MRRQESVNAPHVVPDIQKCREPEVTQDTDVGVTFSAEFSATSCDCCLEGRWIYVRQLVLAYTGGCDYTGPASMRLWAQSIRQNSTILLLYIFFYLYRHRFVIRVEHLP